MQLTKELIESLLWEEESSTLDFKQEQVNIRLRTRSVARETMDQIWGTVA